MKRFKVGDRVKVINAKYSNAAKTCLGKTGFIIRIDPLHYFPKSSEPPGIAALDIYPNDSLWSSEIELDTAWYNEQKLKKALGING